MQIGTMEMLLATAWNGIAYALFSGQPLTVRPFSLSDTYTHSLQTLTPHPHPTTNHQPPIQIIGSTGPVLAFTLVLYRTAQSLGLAFLPLYSWVGIWTSLILLISSVTSFSNLVNYLTRFTDEIFSLLISAIFLFEGR